MNVNNGRSAVGNPGLGTIVLQDSSAKPGIGWLNGCARYLRMW